MGRSPAKLDYQTRRARKMAATMLEGEIRARALEAGITLRASVMESRRKKKSRILWTWHWMFDDAATGARLLDYWPATGRWRDRLGRCGNVADPWEVLDRARYSSTPSDPPQ